jgi:hypothetical protein
MDNWGVDVVAEHGAKVARQIDAAVGLAQLLSSIRNDEPFNSQKLDTDILKNVAFFDGSDGQTDHFFSLELRPLFRGGSYQDDRVSASFNTGFLRLEPSPYTANPDEATFGSYDMRWSTLRGDVVAGRPVNRFEQDLRRIINATEALQGLTQETVTTERPETWPSNIPNLTAYKAGIKRMCSEQAIYIGKSPSTDLAPEPGREISIPFLDD